MNQQQQRTIRLDPTQHEGEPLPAGESDCLVAAVGMLRRTSSGRSVQETLEAAGITLPAAHQTLRVNNQEERDLRRIVQPGDKVIITNRVMGG